VTVGGWLHAEETAVEDAVTEEPAVEDAVTVAVAEETVAEETVAEELAPEDAVAEEPAPQIQEELVPDDQSLPDDEAGEPAEPDPFPLAAETSWEPGPPLWESVLGTDADETADEPPAQPV